MVIFKNPIINRFPQLKQKMEEVAGKMINENDVTVEGNNKIQQTPEPENSRSLVTSGFFANKRVAIKTPRKKTNMAVRDAGYEAVRLCKLQHPNIITCFGFVETADSFKIILEYMHKGSLTAVIASSTPYDWQKCEYFFKGLTEALQYLHANNILHGDIKSDNCLVDEKDQIKLADFETSTEGTTRTPIIATLFWMAPEVFKMKYTQKSDVFSLGVVGWQIAAWQPQPYNQFHDPLEFEKYIAAGNREEIPDCPSKFRKFIASAWAQNPDQRPTAPGLLDILNESEQILENAASTNRHKPF